MNKERIRQYMHQRVQDRTPPPSNEEIRRRVGWPMEEAKRKERERRGGK